MQEHTVKAFDEDITRLRGLIAEMGGLAEVAIQRSLEALVKGDDALAKQVIKGDKRIDALESEIDKLAIRVIALRAPMADRINRSGREAAGPRVSMSASAHRCSGIIRMRTAARGHRSIRVWPE